MTPAPEPLVDPDLVPEPEPDAEDPDCEPLPDPVPVPVCAIANGSEITAASVVIRNFFIWNVSPFESYSKDYRSEFLISVITVMWRTKFGA